MLLECVPCLRKSMRDATAQVCNAASVDVYIDVATLGTQRPLLGWSAPSVEQASASPDTRQHNFAFSCQVGFLFAPLDGKLCWFWFQVKIEGNNRLKETVEEILTDLMQNPFIRFL